MGRRRLALRQIEETPDERHASDPDSDAEPEEPNFNLLGFAAAGGVADGVASAAAATETAAQQDQERSNVDAPPHAPSVFHLYQDGLAPDQMLQLAFIRRRAPRSLRDAKVRVEDEFVVPRPTLSLSNFLPSRVDVPLEKLWINGNTGATYTDTSPDALPLEPTERRIVASASKFFSQPRGATDEEVAQWRRLAECDWRQVYQEFTQYNDISVADVCYGLERCQSDALTQFVWEDLLITLVEQALHEPMDDEDSEESTHHPSEPPLQQVRELLAVLVRHPSLASMPPKQFRAAVRAKNFRRIDATAGAQLELELVTLFQRQRQQQQRPSGVVVS